MTMPTWLRSEGSVATARVVPERLTGTASAGLLVADLLVIIGIVLLVGLPPNAIPTACLLLGGSLWAIGGARISYALRAFDECYHVLAAVALAAIPLFGALALIGGFRPLHVLLVLPIATILLSLLHVLAHRLRWGDATVSDAAVDAVGPKAKRRAALPAVRVYRRCIDMCIGTIALIIAAPFMLVIAAVILVQSGLPILFAQERVGLDRHRFIMLKFRTMRNDAGREWVQPGDERITKFGAFLRRTSLDELPQLFNVLRGEMSLVGPRPEMLDFAEEFRNTIPRYDERTLVTPGITGWAQVQLKRNLTPDEMREVVPYDLFYVEYASVGLDSFILAKTFCEVLAHQAV